MNRKKFFIALPLLALVAFTGLITRPASGLARLQQASETPTDGPTAGVPGFITSTPNPDGSVHHIVREGEFLITISQAYGVPVLQIQLLNNLDDQAILQVGQDLIIMKAGSIEMPTATLNPTEQAVMLAASQVPPTLNIQEALGQTSTAMIVTQFAGKIGPGTPYPSATPTRGPGIFQRVFSSQARYIGLGVIGIVVFGLILLVISARKMQQ